MSGKFIITKDYHFHYGHRNQYLTEDKCFRAHGHTAHIKVHIDTSQFAGRGITKKFSDIDEIVKPIIKAYDHYFLVDVKDTKLREAFDLAGLEYRIMSFPTSAENMAKHFYEQIASELPVASVEFKETTSSTVIYNG